MAHTVSAAANLAGITTWTIKKAIERGTLETDDDGAVVEESLARYRAAQRTGRVQMPNLLTVVSEPGAELFVGRFPAVKVRCQCGTEKLVAVRSLPVTKSCGCQRSHRLLGNNQLRQAAPVEFLGRDTFGDLRLVREVEPRVSSRGRRIRMAEWQCRCGSTKVISMENVRRGLSSTCGCGQGGPGKPRNSKR